MADKTNAADKLLATQGALNAANPRNGEVYATEMLKALRDSLSKKGEAEKLGLTEAQVKLMLDKLEKEKKSGIADNMTKLGKATTVFRTNELSDDPTAKDVKTKQMVVLFTGDKVEIRHDGKSFERPATDAAKKALGITVAAAPAASVPAAAKPASAPASAPVAKPAVAAASAPLPDTDQRKSGKVAVEPPRPIATAPKQADGPSPTDAFKKGERDFLAKQKADREAAAKAAADKAALDKERMETDGRSMRYPPRVPHEEKPAAEKPAPRIATTSKADADAMSTGLKADNKNHNRQEKSRSAPGAKKAKSGHGEAEFDPKIAAAERFLISLGSFMSTDNPSVTPSMKFQELVKGIDGRMDKGLEKALRNYQELNGLDQTGKLDTDTVAMMQATMKLMHIDVGAEGVMDNKTIRAVASFSNRPPVNRGPKVE